MTSHQTRSAPTTPRIIGVDLSLTSTGVASAGWTDRITSGDKTRGLPRLRLIRTAILDFTRHADLVVLEGPAYGSQRQSQQGHHERAGLWWNVYEALDSADIPVAVAPPNTRAMYATGKGNASKDLVLTAVVRRFTGYSLSTNDEADALILAAMGYDHLDHPLVQMPAAHRAALNGVTWPTFTRGPL